VNATDILELSWLVPAFPLLGSVLLLLFGAKVLREPAAGALATLMMLASFAWSVVLFVAMLSLDAEERRVTTTLFEWIPAGGSDALSIKASMMLDPLSMSFLLFVTGVATLIHVFAVGYMHGDERFSRFFLYLNLFAFSMIVLVLGGNYLVTFLGWEGVGLCSYLLISFWFERPSAASAGKKAFITNRVGDFGFMIAMFLILDRLGTLEYGGETGVLNGAWSLFPDHTGTATAIALLLFVGAVGKSAQFPLHVWLPDAMEGPTPVSALIHAATMVTAGIYLVARSYVFFEVSPDAGTVVAWIGIITAFGAATIALVKYDIKRVLAYSTLSQLGYMVMALGIGAYPIAIFHVITHAFFKALLFLGAGSVIHGVGGEQDMRKMGGLRTYMPVTYKTFIVAWLAICGIFPFAGFWSKDEILAKAWFGDSSDKIFWAIGLATAILTAFYMTRQVRMVFFGEERWREAPVIAGAAVDDDAADEHAHDEPVHGHDAHGAHGHGGEPHESPPSMLFPLVVLAVLSVVGGFLALPFSVEVGDFELGEGLVRWLEPAFLGTETVHPDSFGAGFVMAMISLAGALFGVVAAWRVYGRYRPTVSELVEAGLVDEDAAGVRYGEDAGGGDPVIQKLGPLAPVLEAGYGVDRAYAAVFVDVGEPVAEATAQPVDQGFIDATVNDVGALFRLVGTGVSKVQSGFVRAYGAVMLLGVAGLVTYAIVRAS
jgi:NADH-quinone oxidoreductase subunit L